MSKLSKEKLLSIIQWEISEMEFAIEDINSDESMVKKYKRRKQAHQQIKEMIQKPEVTEEWIEEKTKEMVEIIKNYCFSVGELRNARPDAMSFIRSLVEEGK